MKKKWILTGIAVALGSLVACGDGEISKPTSEDESLYYLQDSDYYAGLMSSAMESCKSDPSCAGKIGDIESSSSLSSSSSTESSSSVEESSSSILSSSSALSSSSEESSSSAERSSSSIDGSSSSAESSSSLSSSSSAESSSSVEESSSSEEASSSSGAEIVYTDKTLDYGKPEVEISAGAYHIYSTNQWSGVLRCRADVETVVLVNGESKTIGTYLNSVDGASPRTNVYVALIVPENESIFCTADW